MDQIKGQVYPSAARLWHITGIFFLAQIFSIMDRQLLFLMVDDIRTDLLISDLEISVLQGLAFALFYAFVGLPLGLLADKRSRKWLAIFGVTTWSCATVATAFADTFWHMFAARLAIGLGEATLAPCFFSMIGDLAPPQLRGKPISAFLMGMSLGKGITVGVVGFLLAAAGSGAFADWPVLADLVPWRTTFTVCGLGGLLVSIMMLTYREPVRRNQSDLAGRTTPEYKKAFFYFTGNRQTLLPFYLAHGAASIATYGLAAWAPSILSRQYGFSALDIGAWYGTTLIVASLVAGPIGGAICDSMARTGSMKKRLTLLMALPPLVLCLGSVAGYAPSGPIAAVMMGVSQAGFLLIGINHMAVLQDLVPANHRGFATSLVNFVGTLLGFSAGPLLVAFATQVIFVDPAMLGNAILLVVLPMSFLATALYTVAKRNLNIRPSRSGVVEAVV